MKRLTPLLLLALLCACHGKGLPEGVMDKEAMVGFLTEAYRLEAYNNVMYKGRTAEVAPEVRTAYDDLLRRMDIDAATVEQSINYYSQHPLEYKEILEEVNRTIEQ